jgi:hypothetical protein
VIAWTSANGRRLPGLRSGHSLPRSSLLSVRSLGREFPRGATRAAAAENRATQIALAQENRETQRALAHDVARRDWRKQQMSVLWAAVSERPGLYFRIRLELHTDNRQKAQALLDELVGALPVNEHSWRAAGPTIEKAVLAYCTADSAYLNLLEQQPPILKGDEETKRAAELNRTAQELLQAIEDYIFSD